MLWPTATRPLLVGLALLTGCLRSATYQCTQDDDCTRGGVAGHCEATSYCSFDADGCPGGRKYDPSAGPLADTCVGGVADAGADATLDAGVDAAVCPADRVPPCHPHLGTGPECEPIALNDSAHQAMGLVLLDHELRYGGGDNQLRAVSIAGIEGTPYPSGGADVVQVAADGLNVYWTDYYDGVIRGASLSPPHTPFDVTTLAGAPLFGRMVVQGATLYVAGTDGVYMAPTDGSQGSATRVVTRTSRGDDPDLAFGLAIDATHLYYVDGGTVRRIPLAHLGDDTFAEDVGHDDAAGDLALDDTRVYWTRAGGVAWRDKAGLEPTVVAVDASRTRGLTLDATHVYWSTSDGRIMRVVKGGTAAEIQVLASGLVDPYMLQVDCGAFYWGSYRFGSHGPVYKAALPR